VVKIYFRSIILSFREKIYRFMMGRYGIDELYNFLMVLDLIILVINVFVETIWLSFLVFAIVFYSLFRVFSRNIPKRQSENRKYLNIKYKIRSFFGSFSKKSKPNDRKTHVFRICPYCKAKLRLPRKKGPHRVRCPRCSALFEVQIR